MFSGTVPCGTHVSIMFRGAVPCGTHVPIINSCSGLVNYAICSETQLFILSYRSDSKGVSNSHDNIDIIAVKKSKLARPIIDLEKSNISAYSVH